MIALATWTTSRSVRRLGLVGFLLWTTSSAVAMEIGPDDDLCSAIAALPAGEELLLRAGDYRAGCKVRRGGRPDKPTRISAADPAAPPRLVYPGHAANLIEIQASDVVVRGLHFAAGMADADGVRIISGDRVTVEDCEFSQLGGIAVAATHVSVRHLTVRRNVVQDSGATGMYFGCHDGLGCMHSDLVVEKNYIRGVSAAPSAIGYGMQVKLNSSGVIRDNVVVDTKGPGIMVYGAHNLLTPTVIERNFVQGSRTSSGIVIGGGPAIVRNNVAVWNAEAGIELQNYGNRGLLRRIVVSHNTVYGNSRGGIVAAEQVAVEARIENNAVHATGGAAALPAPHAGLRLVGNVNCTWVPCFVNAEGLDFSPFPGSLLIGPGVLRALEAGPTNDFFGTPRSEMPAIGAIEPGHEPIVYGVKR